jgi:hypothetical protein
LDPSTTLPLTVTLAVLVAAVTHATWNAIAHGSKDQTLAFALIGVGGIIVAIPLTIVAATPRPDCWPYLLGSIVIHVLASAGTSRQSAPGHDPRVRLAGRGCDVLEVRIVVKDYRTMVFCHRSGQQVDHAGGPVMTTGCHPDLDIAGPVRHHLADRQDDIEFLAALRDQAHVSEIAA